MRALAPRAAALAAAMLPLALAATPLAAQGTAPDPALLTEIRAIRAIDNHSHLVHLASTDTALPADPRGTESFPYPVRLRVGNAEWAAVWRALYGTTGSRADSAHAREALRRKRGLMRTHGDRWPVWVLDRLGIETALVDMTALGAGMEGPRFRWVPRGNSLVFPFGVPGGRPAAAPATLGAQERAVVEAVARWRAAGALAVKLSIAYQRSLAVSVVTQPDAERAWQLLASDPARAGERAQEYRTVQDYLIRVLAREVGAAGLVLHVHTGIGADPYFNLAGADPLLLEPLLGDTAVRRTRVVLIHGGWPFDRQAGAMLIRPNIWADFSAHTFLRSEQDLAQMLRGWLEWYPEKVLFGSDAYPEEGAPVRGWEEYLGLASETARRALAIALTGMMRDGQITRARASELARMVLRDNARALYGL